MNKIKCLSNNTLKIIACISMFFDHFGFLIFPNKIIYRVIGRLAFPIFAYMIAEGSLHTKNKTKHLLIIGWLGIIMQIVLYYFTGMQDFSIFIHFTFSIILIRLFDYFIDNIKQKKYILSVLGIVTFILLTGSLYYLTENTPYFFMNYGFTGIMLPVVIYLIKRYIPKFKNLIIFISIIVIIYLTARKLALPINNIGIISVLLLQLYNGKRGKLKLKYFFYLFYPLHFVVIYGISLLLTMF